ncbi:serum response factor-binding protein 1-like, partial [Sinocyclocheilus anshuiensis]|uniref:serum response factor-binding protein 1-like n=1 Tax=Sinocyclocheilus anshuiensis TaxID=1608454 RepID=UPI0007B97B69
CIDDVTDTKTIPVRANQKLWLTGEVYRLLKTWNTAFRAGDEVGLKTARANLSRSIREAKRQYSRSIAHSFSDSRDTRNLWQGIQTITDYKPPPRTCDSTISLLKELNVFFARFEGPAIDARAVEGQATEARAVEGPAVDARAAEGPAAEAPPVEARAVEAPAVEGPAAEAPAEEGPAAEAPAVEARAVEGPATEAPAIEERAVEGPAVEARAVEGPAVKTRAVEGPAMEA